MTDKEKSISDAIFAIAESLNSAQCCPPAGAKFPIELFVSIRFDEDTRSCFDNIASNLDAISNSLDVIAENIKNPKVYNK